MAVAVQAVLLDDHVLAGGDHHTLIAAVVDEVGVGVQLVGAGDGVALAVDEGGGGAVVHHGVAVVAEAGGLLVPGGDDHVGVLVQEAPQAVLLKGGQAEGVGVQVVVLEGDHGGAGLVDGAPLAGGVLHHGQAGDAEDLIVAVDVADPEVGVGGVDDKAAVLVRKAPPAGGLPGLGVRADDAHGGQTLVEGPQVGVVVGILVVLGELEVQEPAGLQIRKAQAAALQGRLTDDDDVFVDGPAPGGQPGVPRHVHGGAGGVIDVAVRLVGPPQGDVAVVENHVVGQALVGGGVADGPGDGGIGLIVVHVRAGQLGVIPLGVHKAQAVGGQGLAGLHIVSGIRVVGGVRLGGYQGAHDGVALVKQAGDVVLEGDHRLAVGVDVAPLAVLLHGGQAVAELAGGLVLGGDDLGVGEGAPLRGGLLRRQGGRGQGQGQAQGQPCRGQALGQVLHGPSSFLLSYFSECEVP